MLGANLLLRPHTYIMGEKKKDKSGIKQHGVQATEKVENWDLPIRFC